MIEMSPPNLERLEVTLLGTLDQIKNMMVFNACHLAYDYTYTGGDLALAVYSSYEPYVYYVLTQLLHQDFSDKWLIKARELGHLDVIHKFPHQLIYYLLMEKRMIYAFELLPTTPDSLHVQFDERLFEAIEPVNILRCMRNYPFMKAPTLAMPTNYDSAEQIIRYQIHPNLKKYLKSELGQEHAARTKLFVILCCVADRKIGEMALHGIPKKLNRYCCDHIFAYRFLEDVPQKLRERLYEAMKIPPQRDPTGPCGVNGCVGHPFPDYQKLIQTIFEDI